LASRRIRVTSAQVSMLRKSAARNGSGQAASVHAIPLDHLMAAKILASRLGGIESAQQALASLAKLMRA
jgi:hypothetical protein